MPGSRAFGEHSGGGRTGDVVVEINKKKISSVVQPSKTLVCLVLAYIVCQGNVNWQTSADATVHPESLHSKSGRGIPIADGSMQCWHCSPQHCAQSEYSEVTRT